MFDVGFSEILLIALVSLIVFGPERLPKMVRETTYWIRKIKGAMSTAKTEIDRELQLMELRTSMEEKRKKFAEETETLRRELDVRLESEEDSRQNKEAPHGTDGP